MKSNKKILGKALRAALEANLLLFPLGILFFFPFAQTYKLQESYQTFVFAGLCSLVFSFSISLFVLVPATTFIERVKEDVSRPELAGSLNAISLVLVLGATLAYKGFTKPGSEGKILLFGLLMTIIFITYIFTVRYKVRTENLQEGDPPSTNTQ